MTAENTKLSLAECRKVLNKSDVQYTDEQVIMIRDWLYHFGETAIMFLEKNPDFNAAPEMQNKDKP